MSDEYLLYRAARYIGCTPWELASQPVVWMNWALMFESAEAWAENERQAHALSAAKQRG